MAKKITVEVDADTTKAKRKLQELAESVGSSAGAGAAGASAKGVARDLATAASAAKKIAESMDKQSEATQAASSLSKEQAAHLTTAANAAKKLADSTYQGNANLRAMTKVFGGMAIRMAASYAAQSMPEGSTERIAVDAGGAALAGALQGSVAGPIGALAGGLMGLTQALMNATAEEKARKEAIYATNAANREQLEAMLAAEQRTEKFKDSLKALTEIEDAGERNAKIRAALEGKQADLSKNADILTGHSSKFQGDDAKFRATMSERSALKGEISQLAALLDRKDTKPADFRASMSALDSLSRIGGNFGGGDVGRDQLNVQREMAATLKSLDQKSSNGGGIWQ